MKMLHFMNVLTISFQNVIDFSLDVIKKVGIGFCAFIFSVLYILIEDLINEINIINDDNDNWLICFIFLARKTNDSLSFF